MEIAALIVGVIGLASPFIISFIKSNSNRPLLDVHVSYQRGQSAPRGISPLAQPRPGEDYFRADETLKVFELRKNIVISLINNSDYDANNARLHIHGDSFKPKINPMHTIEPIRAGNRFDFEGSYTELEHKIPSERTDSSDFPITALRDGFKVLVEYENSKKKKLYTQFTGLDNQNKYLKSRPKGFE